MVKMIDMVKELKERDKLLGGSSEDKITSIFPKKLGKDETKEENIVVTDAKGKPVFKRKVQLC